MLKSGRNGATSSGSALAQIDRIQNRDHFVQFYNDEETLVDCVARYFAVGFAQGNVAILIATKDHRLAIETRLRETGLDLDDLRESGDYSAFDAREMLAHFMIGDKPDAQRFRALLGSWMDVAMQSGAGVRAFGEMVALLCEDGNEAGAIELEQLWNELANRYEFLLYCAYPSSHFAQAGKTECLSQVCTVHSRVISG